MWIRPAQRWENIEVRGGSGKVSGSGLARRYLGHTNRSRGKEYRPVANFLLSKRIDLDRRTKSEGYVSKSPISCKLPLEIASRLATADYLPYTKGARAAPADRQQCG